MPTCFFLLALLFSDSLISYFLRLTPYVLLLAPIVLSSKSLPIVFFFRLPDSYCFRFLTFFLFLISQHLLSYRVILTPYSVLLPSFSFPLVCLCSYSLRFVLTPYFLFMTSYFLLLPTFLWLLSSSYVLVPTSYVWRSYFLCLILLVLTSLQFTSLLILVPPSALSLTFLFRTFYFSIITSALLLHSHFWLPS